MVMGSSKFYSPPQCDSVKLLTPESEGTLLNLSQHIVPKQLFESRKEPPAESALKQRMDPCFSACSAISTQHSITKGRRPTVAQSTASLSTTSDNSARKYFGMPRAAKDPQTPTTDSMLHLDYENKAERSPEQRRLLSFTSYQGSNVTLLSAIQTHEIREATEEDKCGETSFYCTPQGLLYESTTSTNIAPVNADLTIASSHRSGACQSTHDLHGQAQRKKVSSTFQRGCSSAKKGPARFEFSPEASKATTPKPRSAKKSTGRLKSQFESSKRKFETAASQSSLRLEESPSRRFMAKKLRTDLPTPVMPPKKPRRDSSPPIEMERFSNFISEF